MHGDARPGVQRALRAHAGGSVKGPSLARWDARSRGAEVKKCLSPTSLAQGRGFQGPPVESSGPVADEQVGSCAARHMSIKHVV